MGSLQLSLRVHRYEEGTTNAPEFEIINDNFILWKINPGHVDVVPIEVANPAEEDLECNIELVDTSRARNRYLYADIVSDKNEI